MAIINYDGISGINSITSVGGGVKFYDTTGASSFTITPSGTGGATLGDVTVSSINSGPISGARNRIINGDMQIDQRNAVAISNSYTVDRWQFFYSSTGAAQSAKSGDYPPTFSSSLLFDVTTADTSIASTEYALFVQPVEGFNVSDLAWGSASAQYVTLSFWIKSTTIGTYCVNLRNNDATRSYVAEYSVLVANTWEKKIITIPGDTSGTWLTDNSAGIRVCFTFATGTTYQTTANAWVAGNFIGTSNQVNLLANTANEARITGVQLEAGTVATPFERRSYGQELALCYRYYRKYNSTGTTYTAFGSGLSGGAASISRWGFNLDIPMRTTIVPSFTNCVGWNGGVGGAISASTNYSSTNFVDIDLTTSGMTATTGLIAKVLILSNGYIELTSEL